MPTSDDALVDAITTGVPTLLQLLDALSSILERFQPQHLAQVLTLLETERSGLRAICQHLGNASFPEHVARFGQLLTLAMNHAERAMTHLEATEHDPMRILAAHRSVCRAKESLYPTATLLAPIHEFFLEPSARRSTPLTPEAITTHEGAQLIHHNHERESRGGYSLYVPQSARIEPRPLIIALHGGTGHGRDTLWHWLSSARSRDMSLIAPTSIEDTWSLFQPEIDLHALIGHLETTLEHLERPSKVLLAGMSDGATFSLQIGLRRPDLFPSIAPFSGMLDPTLLIEPLSGIAAQHIYWVHGHFDTMFPFELASESVAALKARGLNVTLDAQSDLGHNFAASIVPAVLDWFDQGESISG